MTNLAVYEGVKDTVMNVASDPRNVKWTIIPTSDEFGTYPITQYGGYRDPSFTRLFYPNQSGLVIFNATTAPTGADQFSTAGLYLAQCENGNQTAAKLIVVREYIYERMF